MSNGIKDLLFVINCCIEYQQGRGGKKFFEM